MAPEFQIQLEHEQIVSFSADYYLMYNCTHNIYVHTARPILQSKAHAKPPNEYVE